MLRSPRHTGGVYIHQSIPHPGGVTVFGSCLLTADPDYAALRFAVTRAAEDPSKAFAAVRDGVRSVRAALAAAGIADRDLRTSQLTLEPAFEGYAEKRRQVGYASRAAFIVLIGQLDRVEDVLASVVAAGADAIDNLSFKTRRVRELREQARRGAVASARVKAEQYCLAAGARLGPVLHIEDVNPDELTRRSHMPDIDLSAHDDASPNEPHNPGSIVIAGAVMVCHAILPPHPQSIKITEDT
jgi:uncharacterized protein YggE